MTVRQTSIQAYQQIKSQGLLAVRRFEVYDWLYQCGPATAQEVERGMRKMGMASGRHANKRLPELRDQGVVEEIGERKCSVTGKLAIVWDVTSLLPKPFRRSSQTRLMVLQIENKKLKELLKDALDYIEKLKCGGRRCPVPKKGQQSLF